VLATLIKKQLCDAATGISRILKHMLKHASEADGSLLGVINQMAVAELLNSGQSLDVILNCLKVYLTSSSRMRVIYHNWSATKQRPHPQSVAEISRHSVLSGDRIRQCETSSGSHHKDTDQCL